MSVLVIAVFFVGKNNCEMDMEMGWGGGGRRRRERGGGIQSILGKQVIPQAKYVDNFQWPNSFKSGMYII